MFPSEWISRLSETIEGNEIHFFIFVEFIHMVDEVHEVRKITVVIVWLRKGWIACISIANPTMLVAIVNRAFKERYHVEVTY